MPTVPLTRGQVRTIANTEAPRFARVAFIGDSITNSTAPGTWGDREYGAWSSLLSGGALCYGGKYGEGGLGFSTPGTSGGTFEGYLAQLLAADPTPEFACILMGQNDFGTITAAQLLADIVDAALRMRAVGIRPVLVTPAPNDTGHPNRWKVRPMLMREGQKRGWPVVDMFAISATNGRWATGDTRDGTHPAIQGARHMGQQVVAQLRPHLPPWTPPLVTDQFDVSALANGLHLTDTNSDGVPDGWQMITNTAAATFALTPAGSDALGNWFSIARTIASGNALVRTQPRLAGAPGDLIAFSARIKYENAEAAGSTAGHINAGKLGLNIAASSGPLVSDPFVGNVITLFATWQGDVAATTIYGEGVVPAGAGYVYIDLNLSAPDAGASQGAGTFSIAQMTLRNLTAAGYVP